MSLPNILIVTRRGAQEILASALEQANAPAWSNCVYSEFAIEATEILRRDGRECRVLILDAQAEESFYVAERSKEWGWKSQIIFVSKLDDLQLRLLAAKANTDAFFLLPDEATDAINHARFLCNQ